MSSARRWSLVGLLLIAAFVNYLDRVALSVALPQVSAEFSLGPAAKGLLLSAFFWSYSLMQVPMGWLADRRSLRWLFAGSFALWSMACGLTGIARTLEMLVLFQIVLGVGESIYFPGSMKLIRELFAPQSRGLPSGLLDSGTRTGLAVGAPLVAWLIVRYGWRNMFFVVGFLALAWIFVWISVCPSELSNNKPGLRGQVIDDFESPRPSFTLDRNLVGCCIGFGCYGYYQYLLVTWVPDFFVHGLGLGILKAGAYASVTYLVWALSSPLGGWIADRLIHRGWNETRVRKGMITVGFLTGMFLLFAARTSNPASAMRLLAVASLVGLSTANLLVVFQCCAPKGEIGIWMGTGNFAGNIGGVVSPLLTGVLISRTGSYFAGFALAPVVLLTGLLSYWFVVGELKPLRTDVHP